MTTTQLRAFAAVARAGSVKAAAAELGVSQAAVSLNVAQLRKEVDDVLFIRTATGLVFTSGGRRLARRATELLALHDQTVREVRQASSGRGVLRIAATPLFAEYAAPGVLELFTSPADAPVVELYVCEPGELGELLSSRAIDVAIGSRRQDLPASITQTTFVNYEIAVVAGPLHPLARRPARPAQLREQTWLLGPTDGEEDLVDLLSQLDVMQGNLMAFATHAAALAETRRNRGLSLALNFAVTDDVASGRLVVLSGPNTRSSGAWSAMRLAEPAGIAGSDDLIGFLASPRGIKAMLAGSGVEPGRFRSSTRLTFWSRSAEPPQY